MKGKLKQIDKVWSVIWEDAEKKTIVTPLHPDNVNEINEWAKIFDNIEARIAGNPDVDFYITIDANINMVTEYAVLVKNNEENDWDYIFNEIEVNLKIDLPIRLKNWLRNTFHSPIKK